MIAKHSIPRTGWQKKSNVPSQSTLIQKIKCAAVAWSPEMSLRGMVAETQTPCGKLFWELTSLNPLWDSPPPHGTLRMKYSKKNSWRAVSWHI